VAAAAVHGLRLCFADICCLIDSSDGNVLRTTTIRRATQRTQRKVVGYFWVQVTQACAQQTQGTQMTQVTQQPERERCMRSFGWKAGFAVLTGHFGPNF